MTHIPGRRRWRPRTRKNPPPARPPDPDAATQDGPAEAASIQLAIGLLTASLDSPQLEAWGRTSPDTGGSSGPGWRRRWLAPRQPASA
jgi:hypothetical protein